MGFNTTVVVLNDAVDSIRNDKDFGRKLADAITHRAVTSKPIDVSAGNHVNAALVVESHHADELKAILVGGNYGEDLGYIGRWDLKVEEPEDKKEVLRSVARLLGMKVSIREK